MAREPFNSLYLDERPIEQYAKKREIIFLQGVTIIEDAKKKKTGQIPPPEKKKKNILRIHFHPIVGRRSW